MLLAMPAFAPFANAQTNGRAPMMSAQGWVTVENAGDTWDGTWTFTDPDHRTMSGSWTDRKTGQQITAPRMSVRQSGEQIIVERPGVGNYVGTLSPDGRSITGAMTWISGNFTARIAGGNDRRGNDRPVAAYGPPMMSAQGWVTVENAGQTWDGTWTFTDPDHRTMSGTWVNRQTGERVYAARMSVRQDGRQIIITRPDAGNYVGTISADGRSISGTMSWLGGHFTAHM